VHTIFWGAGSWNQSRRRFGQIRVQLQLQVARGLKFIVEPHFGYKLAHFDGKIGTWKTIATQMMFPMLPEHSLNLLFVKVGMSTCIDTILITWFLFWELYYLRLTNSALTEKSFRRLIYLASRSNTSLSGTSGNLRIGSATDLTFVALFLFFIVIAYFANFFVL